MVVSLHFSLARLVQVIDILNLNAPQKNNDNIVSAATLESFQAIGFAHICEHKPDYPPPPPSLPPPPPQPPETVYPTPCSYWGCIWFVFLFCSLPTAIPLKG